MPREIYKLKKLRHLLAHDRFFGLMGRVQMEGGIGVLTSLQTLRDMEADYDAEEVMKELERLTQGQPNKILELGNPVWELL